MGKLIRWKLLVLAVVTLSPRIRAETEPSFAESRKLVVVDAINFLTESLPKTIHERERFFAAFRKSLSDKRWEALVQPSDSSCTSGNQCLSSIARDAGAPYALRISGEGNLVHGYTLHIYLYSPSAKRSQQATAYCDICLTDRMAAIASDFALRLLDDEAKEEQALKDQSIVAAAVPRAAKAQPLAARSVAVLPPTTKTSPSHVGPFLSWSLIAAGVVGMAYGGWALSKNGDTAGDSELGSGQVLARDKYTTTTVGATSLAMGGVLALVGAILVVTEPSSTARASLASAPDGLSLRF